MGFYVYAVEMLEITVTDDPDPKCINNWEEHRLYYRRRDAKKFVKDANDDARCKTRRIRRRYVN